MCSGARSSSAKIASSWRADLGVRVCDFEQHSPVALHDERTVSHKDRSYSAASDAGIAVRRRRNQDAGRTLTMLETGRVRSTSAPRSRPRRRPPPRPGRLEGQRALGAVGHPHDDDDHGLRAHRLLELAAEPGRVGIRLVSRAQRGDQARVRVARFDVGRRIRGPRAAVQRLRSAGRVERDDRIAGVGERPVHRVARDPRGQLVAVADESQRAQRLVDEDRVAQRQVGRLETRASRGLVGAHPDEPVPRGGALDEVVQRLRDAGQRDSARGTRGSNPRSRPRSCPRRAIRC